MYKIQLSKKYVILILFVLVLTNFVIATSLEKNYEGIMWVSDSDDIKHIGTAYNFWKDNSFETNYLGEWITNYSFDDLTQKFSQVKNEQSRKGPLFYIFLGTFYKLTNPEPENIWLYSSFFNTLASSTFIVLFFLLIYKKFNLRISLFSSFIVLFTPYFEIFSFRVTPMMLFGIFSICAFFFLEKRNSHYFLLGLFSGLAHLTHPFAIFLPVSYAIFLLIKREFKGFIIVILTWNVILIPWFVRNYYFFKNIGAGLYLPFSSLLSSPLSSFLPTIATDNSVGDVVISRNPDGGLLSPFHVIYGMYNNIGFLYHMDFLLIFILSFTGFAFISIGVVRHKMNVKSLIRTFATFSSLIIAYQLIFHALSGEIFFQYFMIFGLPIILVLMLYRFQKTIFVTPITRYQLLIIILAIVYLSGYLYTSFLLDRAVPVTRQMMFLLFMAIPLSLLGCESVLRSILESILNKTTKINSFLTKLCKNKKICTERLVIILLLFILIPIFYHMISGIEDKQNLSYGKESENHVELNKFLVSEIPPDTVVMSDFPAATMTRTGLTSIHLYPEKYNTTEKIAYIDHFDIKYVVFYNLDGPKYDWMKKQLIHQDNNIYPKYSFNLLYENSGSRIYKIGSLNETYILEKLYDYQQRENPVLIVASSKVILEFYDNEIKNAIKNNDNMRGEKLKTAVNNIINTQIDILTKLQNQTKNKIEQAEYEYVPNLLSDLYELIVYKDTMIESLSEFEYYKRIEKIKDTQIEDPYSVIHEINKKIITNTLDEMVYLFSENKEKEAITEYNKAKMYFEETFTIAKKYSLSNIIDDTKEKKNILMHKTGELLIEQERYNDAVVVYNELMGEYRFDGKVWLQLGKIYEKQGDTSQAIYHYDMASRLLDDSSINEKLDDLLKN